MSLVFPETRSNRRPTLSAGTAGAGDSVGGLAADLSSSLGLVVDGEIVSAEVSAVILSPKIDDFCLYGARNELCQLFNNAFINTTTK